MSKVSAGVQFKSDVGTSNKSPPCANKTAAARLTSDNIPRLSGDWSRRVAYKSLGVLDGRTGLTAAAGCFGQTGLEFGWSLGVINAWFTRACTSVSAG